MSRLSTNQEDTNGNLISGYDYERQAWVLNGKYQRCGHPDSMGCNCYGRIHEGEATSRISDMILMEEGKKEAVYKIMGMYQGETEEIDSFSTYDEAERMVSEYRMSFGAGWSIWIKAGQN